MRFGCSTAVDTLGGRDNCTTLDSTMPSASMRRSGATTRSPQSVLSIVGVALSRGGAGSAVPGGRGSDTAHGARDCGGPQRVGVCERLAIASMHHCSNLNIVGLVRSYATVVQQRREEMEQPLVALLRAALPEVAQGCCVCRGKVLMFWPVGMAAAKSLPSGEQGAPCGRGVQRGLKGLAFCRLSSE